MAQRSVLIVLVLVAVVGSGIAVAEGANVGGALSAAAVAIAAAAVAGAWVLGDRVRRPARRPGFISADRYLPLRDAFVSGRLGRQAVVATLRSLEREMLGGNMAAITPEEEHRLLTVSSGEFRQWATSRMERIELAT